MHFFWGVSSDVYSDCFLDTYVGVLENRQPVDINFVTHRHYCTVVAAEVQNVARSMSERAKPAHQLITVVNMPNEEALVSPRFETLGNLARAVGHAEMAGTALVLS